jgi:hypothetical protein
MNMMLYRHDTLYGIADYIWYWDFVGLFCFWRGGVEE